MSKQHVWMAVAVGMGLWGAGAMAQNQPTDAEAEARFQEYFKTRDTNGDGKLSAEESAAGLEGQRLEFSKRFFTLMDGDKDQYVTLDEARAFMTKMREAMTKGDEWFNGADVNVDGQVSLSEAKANKTEEESKKIAAIFGKVDRDGDGFINKQELRGGVFMILSGEIKLDETPAQQ